MLDIVDWMCVDVSGKGVINIFSVEKFYQMLKLYVVSLLWMFFEFYECLLEVGDFDKLKLVFFFDEVYLLFNDVLQVLLDKIEQVICFICFKGVGVYFVLQNLVDIFDVVFGQLGNCVQYVLCVFMLKDQKVVKIVVQIMCVNLVFSIEQVIQELGIGEVLIFFFDEKGSLLVVEWVMVIVFCL